MHFTYCVLDTFNYFIVLITLSEAKGLKRELGKKKKYIYIC